METPDATRPDASLSRSRRILAVLLGGGGTLLIILLVLAWRRDGQWTTLTAESLAHAEATWQAAAIENYDIRVKVEGRQAAEYQVQVRDGVAQTALRNGQPLKQTRTFATWSVTGMFATIRTDLDHIERVAAGTADATTPRLTCRVMFDPQLGYPRRYLRIERGGIGGNPEVSWEVVELKVGIKD